MSKAFAFLLSGFCFLYFFLQAADRAMLVHNTLQDIEQCKDKLQLKLICVWGGDKEEDENKFFGTPVSVAVDSDQLFYICDCHRHCVKVFNNSGDYVRTIGRKGQGPGDMYGPTFITFSPVGELLVYETGNRRIQWFNPNGKSKHILKQIESTVWIGVLPGNEIAAYDHLKTFMQRKLISIIDNKGKVLREIGKYHDTAKKLISSEWLHFSLDEEGNICAANNGTPVIRKYSADGKLIRVITFDIPFFIPVEITLNSSGDEIERKEEIESEDNIKITRSSTGVRIQSSEKHRKWRYMICMGFQIDSQNRIFVVTGRRELTEKEALGTAISGNFTRGLNRSRVNYDLVENIDCNHMLVFDSKGKIIAEAPMTTFCDNIYISQNKIFVIDGLINQRVLEYEMVFKK
jgi:hypothetical protein